MLGKDDGKLAALLLAGLDGDDQSYALFLRGIAPGLRGMVRRKVAASGIDAEDVVQETLLAIHMKRHTWRQDAPVLPWVYAIARHKTVDAFRRRGRRVEIDIDDFAETLPAPEPDVASEREIAKALDGLAPGQRAVVSAISVDGKTISETASLLGMNETAVRVALHRGLAAIRNRFGHS